MTTNYLKNNSQAVQFISNGREVTVLFLEKGEVVLAKRVPLPVGRSIYKKLVAKGFIEAKARFCKV